MCHWLRKVFDEARADEVPDEHIPKGDSLQAIAEQLCRGELSSLLAISKAKPEEFSQRGVKVRVWWCAKKERNASMSFDDRLHLNRSSSS